MASFRAKIAALRAKRSAQTAQPVKLGQDIVPSAAAGSSLHTNSDADCRITVAPTPLAVNILCAKPDETLHAPSEAPQAIDTVSLSSDDDNDELVVLPPPVRKLHPAAQRQLWRQKEAERARQKAARELAKSGLADFVSAGVQVEQCSEEQGSDEEDEGEEDAEGEEVDDDGDLEEKLLQSAGNQEEQGEDVGDVDGTFTHFTKNADDADDDVATATLIDASTGSNNDFDPNEVENAVEKTCEKTSVHTGGARGSTDKSPTEHANDGTPPVSDTKTHHLVRNEEAPVLVATEDERCHGPKPKEVVLENRSARTGQEIAHATAQSEDDGQPRLDIEKMLSSAEVGVQSGQGETQPACRKANDQDDSNLETAMPAEGENKKREQQEDSSAEVLGELSPGTNDDPDKIEKVSHDTRIRKRPIGSAWAHGLSGFVDDEAEADDDGIVAEDRKADELYTDDEASMDNDEDEDASIICEDADVPRPSENKKLAAFHRQWQMDVESAHVQAITTSSRRATGDDIDRALDLSELAKDTSDEKQSTGNVSEVEEATGRGDEERAVSSKYMDTMFLRDDSRSKYLGAEDAELERSPKDAEERREKARALWKARQKFKTRFAVEDDNSLSRFDIFKDSDKNRSNHLRMRFESACRPASKRDLKFRDSDKSDKKKYDVSKLGSTTFCAPEWEKRKACTEQREKRRRHGVSVGKWSFTSHGGIDDRSVGKGPLQSSGSVSLGSSFLVRKKRLRSDVGNSQPIRPPISAASRSAKRGRSSKGATSFKGLLSILDERAKADS